MLYALMLCKVMTVKNTFHPILQKSLGKDNTFTPQHVTALSSTAFAPHHLPPFSGSEPGAGHLHSVNTDYPPIKENSSRMVKVSCSLMNFLPIISIMVLSVK